MAFERKPQMATLDFDPTKTKTLRRAFVSGINKRLRNLRGVVRTSIEENDAFGLSSSINNQMISNQQEDEEDKLDVDIIPLIPAFRNAFDFQPAGRKIQEFQKWLDRQLNRSILQTTAAGQLWAARFLQESYKRGIVRANEELMKRNMGGVELDEDDLNRIISREPFRSRFGIVREQLEAELQGLSDNIRQRTSRVVSSDLAQGKTPRQISNDVNREIRLLQNKGQAIARTETVRGHHYGNITALKQEGVEEVEVLSEVIFTTAGDERVCPICRGLEGERFDIEESLGVIPVHPNCRCIFLPAG